MGCDMCGKEGPLYGTMVEGTEMSLCKECSKHGKILREPETKRERRPKKPRKPATKNETVFGITEGFGNKIKRKREEMGLKQEDVGKKLAEKESLLHKIESEHYEPSIELARKLEKFFNIKLIEEQTVSHDIQQKSKSESMTLGDMIKMKK